MSPGPEARVEGGDSTGNVDNPWPVDHGTVAPIGEAL
jgi:hypothetical protein